MLPNGDRQMLFTDMMAHEDRLMLVNFYEK
jgi:hypothetical protein